jgi:S-DNA-T family DNA segregation ATPase FtsK/SpoIIIE
MDLPHLLIAGATGSGKSVCINSIISTMLLTRTPDRVRLILVDPKRVELTPFNGIPHLLHPVVVETEEVQRVLDALLNEMSRRYKWMEESKTRNLEGYNRKASTPLPYLVLIVDELADLMIAGGHESEQALVRLAQLGRATGIHLILATQRPSVNVVTGLLKANIPSRIAFAVASQVDSRVIQDAAGAEKLLGRGDMLYLSSSSPRPRRVQGVYVSDKEIEKLVQFWKSYRGPSLPTSLLQEELTNRVHEETPEDDLLERAREIASQSSHLSPSLLQRRLRIGYPRAMRLIELLEAQGVLAPGAPGTSRKVLVKSGEDFKEPS